MAKDNALLSALSATITYPDVERAGVLFRAAWLLAIDPELALAWGRVLTEHTAPAEPSATTIQVFASVEVHRYYDGGTPGQDICGYWLPNLAAHCGHGEGAAGRHAGTGTGGEVV